MDKPKRNILPYPFNDKLPLELRPENCVENSYAYLLQKITV